MPPRLLAACILVPALALLIAVPVGTSATSRGQVRAAATLNSELLSAINSLRAQHGLGKLRLSSQLSSAARAHSRSMANEGYFAHDSSDGSVWWKRVQRFYKAKGFHSWQVGENLVWASPELSAREAVERWMRSAPHRANLLSKKWREVGLAAVSSESAPGVYGGNPTTIVTADFGSRS